MNDRADRLLGLIDRWLAEPVSDTLRADTENFLAEGEAMKQVTPINSAPKLPNWPAAAAVLHADIDDLATAIAVVLDVQAAPDAILTAIRDAVSAQPSPAISIYDRLYTAHIYPEPGVAEGQVYEALRDYAAQHATPDPAMVEIRCKSMLALLDKWREEGPPSAEDAEFWRQFDADLARARRGGGSLEAAAHLEQLDAVRALLDHWRTNGVTGELAVADLERVLGRSTEQR